MFPIDKAYILVPNRELNDLILKSHWEDFYTRYPEAKSYISVSSVASMLRKNQGIAHHDLQLRNVVHGRNLLPHGEAKWKMGKNFYFWLHVLCMGLVTVLSVHRLVELLSPG